jgi:hypothetical protein
VDLLLSRKEEWDYSQAKIKDAGIYGAVPAHAEGVRRPAGRVVRGEQGNRCGRRLGGWMVDPTA